MSDHIKNTVTKFREENGNDRFSQKELIIYLVDKMEKIDDRLSDHMIMCQRDLVAKTIFYKTVGLFTGAIGLIIGWIIYLHG